MLFKCLVPVLVLCLVQSSQSKPTTNNLSEGRGVGSTLWGWISYPFSWWSSSEPDLPPVKDQLIGLPPYGPYDNIEVAKRNVTVWCNDQTCTTMKCDRFGCENFTCNIYETDMKGECREYNTGMKPEEPITPKPTQPVTVSAIHNEIPTIKPQGTTATPTTSTKASPDQPEEHPLELEAVLSSTVTEEEPEKGTPQDKRNKSSSPQNKV